ncbi:penicillin-binding protein 2 [Novosphingobium resinovorum]|uniref:peptidoglycan D,D-transpeptidase FtsI family protein n=1 Tax=Sphingomonadaceae TaxID=41297 RepID=UPI00027CAE97|nr:MULTISPECIES: penicillin-binding protein 2 [Sphingomonadaceae]EJU11566.1 cell division protein FtsI [Sphingomonas sp. LH128]MBF7012388.1 penicillin-binding protein 2 [Novosphingobium sp. HR1a]WJM27129.1 penicillin-binding protein 2 [Novosphingobium resinovorum]
MNAPAFPLGTIPTTVSVGRRRLVNVRQRSLLTAKARMLWILAVFMLVTVLAIFRIVYLGFTGVGPRQGDLADMLIPARGDIVDRNGVPLARDFRVYSLWYNPKAMTEGSALIHSPEEVTAGLLRIFPDLDRDEILAKLRAGKPAYLRKSLLPEDANKVHALGEPALEFPLEATRFYPQGSMAAHVLGYVDSYGKGKVGMEEAFNDQLISPEGRTGHATLSIDFRVQSALEDELARAMQLSAAKGAAGVVLDVDSGEILALASLPSFDPNHVKPTDMVISAEEARNGDVPHGFNRVTNQVYELGSTFKPITVAAALDAGVVTDLGKQWPATPLHVGRFTIHDLHNYGASLNVPETLIHSSNTVTARIADELGGVRLKKTMEALGMNQRPYVELPAKGFPIWPRGEWPRLRTMTVAYGHGIAVTPLHLASAYAALVNGGIWRPATLKKLAPADVPAGRRVFTAATSARVRQLLRMIVQYGTGRKADAPGFRVGGKTGSAEKPGVGGYRHHSLIATFASAFPMDKPRYVVIAMMDEPQGTAATSYQRTAAWNAAPVIQRVVPRIGPLLGVMPDETRDIDTTDLRPLVPQGSDGE